jgi:hypothetical protein
VHLANCTDFALQFEVVYFVEDADYTVYRDVHQAYLQRLLSVLADKGITLATTTYPFQSSGA